jgi:predicted ATPase
MIVRKIKLHNWKNFQNCEVNITERCFVIGANASGKSNFIDALRFLRDIAKQSGGLQEAVEERGGITKIRCLAARKQTNISITVELGEDNSDKLLWKYHLDFSHTGGGILKNQVIIKQEQVYSYIDKKNILDRNPNSKNEDVETIKYTHLEQVNTNRNFRDIVVFFQNIEYLNIIPQLVRESSLMPGSKKEDFFGRNFLERLSKLNERTRNSYFKKINELLKLAVPQLEELGFVKDNMGIPHLEAKYKHWRAKGSKQQEMQFSDGTLRLIGFLFALIDSKGLILLEEPELNLHSAIIAQLPEFISKIQRNRKGRIQVIITTHSYDILSNTGISTDEVVLLENTQEGTKANIVTDLEDVKQVVNAGLTIADAVLPKTKPEKIDSFSQLTLDF